MLTVREGFLREVTTIPAAFRHPVYGFVGLHVMHKALVTAAATD